jgi:hypothetical protein
MLNCAMRRKKMGLFGIFLEGIKDQVAQPFVGGIMVKTRMPVLP